jgi:hypothetical protein
VLSKSFRNYNNKTDYFLKLKTEMEIKNRIEDFEEESRLKIRNQSLFPEIQKYL